MATDTDRMDRRHFLKDALGVGAAWMLAACGGMRTAPTVAPTRGASQSRGSPQPEATQVYTGEKRSSSAAEVTFWTVFSDIYLQAQQEMVKRFNEQHQDVYVKLVRVPLTSVSDTSKLLTAVRGGTGPDVYMVNRPFAIQSAATGVLQELDQFGITRADVEDRYLPFAAREVIYRGKVYALPFDTDDRALYYRRDLLRKAGVDLKLLDPDQGPPTIDLVRELAAKLDESGPRGYSRLGFIPWYAEGYVHYTWGYVFGGSFYDLQACKVTPLNPGVVKAYEFAYDWAKTYGPQKLQSFLASYVNANIPPSQNVFFTGKLGLMVNGDWMLALIEQYAPKLDYGITYIPVVKQGDEPVTWGGGWAPAIPQGAKQPEAAAKFLAWFCGEEGQRMYVRATAHLPTLKSLVEDHSLYTPRHRFFAQLLPKAKSLAPVPVGALYWDELQAAQEKVVLNQATPQEALQQVDTRVNQQLQQYCPVV